RSTASSKREFRHRPGRARGIGSRGPFASSGHNRRTVPKVVARNRWEVARRLARLLARLLALAGSTIALPCPEALALDPRKAPTQYVHDVWTTDRGLPQNVISSIARSADGYLWLGSDDGLVRFDGLRFELFD